MPPRKRARKEEQTLAPTGDSTTSTSDAPAPAPPSSQVGPFTAQSGPIFELPLELWLEILSYFPCVRIPTRRISDSPLVPSCTLARQEALRALSQTCRAFRSQFLQELWDRFEVCATLGQVERHGGPARDVTDEEKDFELSGAWYKDISEALERKSNGLQQSPEHAKLVHKVSVALTRCNSASVLGAFARCLHALPNLHTLQILRAHTQMTTHLKNAFEGHKFPAIRTVVLPSHAHNVLRCCPEARTVVCNCDDGSKLVSAIAKECKKVQRLEGFSIDEKMMKRIVKAAPNLQEIRFKSTVAPQIVGMLSSLKDIRSIELYTAQPSLEDISNDATLVACMKVARDILRKAPGKPHLVDSDFSRVFSRTAATSSKQDGKQNNTPSLSRACRNISKNLGTVRLRVLYVVKARGTLYPLLDSQPVNLFAKRRKVFSVGRQQTHRLDPEDRGTRI
ncbi:hypothetical protein LshimejAT787_1202580 [Lyophyllum shimeji]|uniref:F-box domain-containing protein n=1 Tax=Lyophyllum shimeji TaxID=47721 RepID=A0A9P3PWJ8_LYOSH|nr:hypothetical protein LshimejAT787_1202580 [Lyophyllum shimeji]